MRTYRFSHATGAGLMIVLVAGLMTATGCGPTAKARLWADAATIDGSFTLQKHQWAYDGEPVMFELECVPGMADYVVFGTDKEETVVNIARVEGRYRWMHVFHCGPKAKTYEVHATPFLIRGKCDWVYDKNEDKWYYYPGMSDKPDVATDSEQRMEITCYRVEIHLKFTAQGGPPKRMELSLLKADGTSKVVPRRLPGSDKPGYLLLGPDAAGACEVSYTPTYDEVSRAGQTGVELIIEHADGSTQRLRQAAETP